MTIGECGYLATVLLLVGLGGIFTDRGWLATVGILGYSIACAMALHVMGAL